MVKEWKGFEVTAKGVGENVTFYETVMDWVTTDDTPVHVEQVVVAKWNRRQDHSRTILPSVRKHSEDSHLLCLES